MSSENKPPVNPNKTYPLLEFYRISQRTYSAAIKKQGFTTALALDEIAIPVRKTRYSAGYDFITPDGISLAPRWGDRGGVVSLDYSMIFPSWVCLFGKIFDGCV